MLMSRTAENVCSTELPANQLNLDWMKVPAVQKRVGCASTHVAKGLYSQPFGSEEEMFAGLGVAVLRDQVPYAIHYNLSLTGYG